MPNLEEIDIMGPDHEGQLSSSLFPALSISGLSKLRVLRLAFVPVALGADVFSRLHCLSLKGHVLDSSSVDCSDVIRVLQRCVELKELGLYRLLSSLPIRKNPHQAISLALPRLQNLEICDIPSVTSYFLSHMRLPPDVTLRVRHPLSTGLSDANMFNAFTSLLPEDTSGLPMLPAVTHASIECWQRRTIALQGGIRDTKVSLKISGSTAENGSFYLNSALREFRRLFAGAPLKEVVMTGYLDGIPSIDDYLSFFEGFPLFVKVEVNGQGSSFKLILALARSSLNLPSDASDLFERSESDAGSGAELTWQIVCPALHSLTVQLVDWQQGLIEAIVTVLQRRLDHRPPKLELLSLVLCPILPEQPDEAEEEVKTTFERYERELQPMVSMFQWEWL